MALLRQASHIQPVTIFGHGAGGSGKTYCVNSVILPLYHRYFPGHDQKTASQHSAARLINGSTMHVLALVIEYRCD